MQKCFFPLINIAGFVCAYDVLNKWLSSKKDKDVVVVVVVIFFNIKKLITTKTATGMKG